MTTVSQVSERQEVERYAAGSRAAGRLGRVKIATRQSLLALWQAEHVRDRLQQLYPGLTVELVPMTTRGDQILDRSLAKIGGKGLFIKELEVAMEAGEADLAVHSCKDVPMALPDGFTLAAMLVREDPRDALLTPRGSGISALDGLAANAVVGTSSLRREAQLRERFPHLQVQPLRGNVDTRIAKLDRGEYAAIILAAAGIKRLGWADRIIVSPDSVNMVSEACATPLPVFVAEPDRARGRVADFLAALLATGRIQVQGREPGRYLAAAMVETARVAALVRTRLSLD